MAYYMRKRQYAIDYENKLNKIKDITKLKKMLDDTLKKIKKYHSAVSSGNRRIQAYLDYRGYIYEERESKIKERIKELEGEN